VQFQKFIKKFPEQDLILAGKNPNIKTITSVNRYSYVHCFSPFLENLYELI